MGCSSANEHPVDTLYRRGRFEKVEGLLNFEADDFVDRFYYVPGFRRLNPVRRLAMFERLSLSKTEVELFLNKVCVLMSPYADIAREEKIMSRDNVDGHNARAKVQQGYRGSSARLVINLVRVLQGEGIHVHYNRILSGHAYHAGVVCDLLLFDRDEKHVQVAGGGAFAQNLIVQIHVGNVEGDVLFRFPANGFRKLFLRLGRQRDLLHND